MRFEEEFPSLRKVYEKGCSSFTPNCLLKTCLDKQKVKEVFEYFIPKEGDRISIPVKVIKQKMKELGIENVK